MKSPKGFGKKYFTFASVLAHSIEKRLQSQILKVDYFLTTSLSEEEKEPDDNLFLDLLAPVTILNQKACHCNCVFNLKTRLSMKINLFIPRCPYYTTYFAFRRTGVHPPYITF